MNLICPSCKYNTIYPFNNLSSTCKCLFVTVYNNEDVALANFYKIITPDLSVGDKNFLAIYYFVIYKNIINISYYIPDNQYQEFNAMAKNINSLNFSSLQDIINAIYKYKSLSSFA